MDESKCSFHSVITSTMCSWCGNRICGQCIEGSRGRKYCPQCYTKLSKNSVAKVLSSRGEKPTGQISNMDYKLTEEELKKIKQTMEIQEKARKIFRKMEKQ